MSDIVVESFASFADLHTMQVVGEVKVAEVLCAGEGRWCDEKLGQWFDPQTCMAIKGIPLPRQNMEDRLVWHGTVDGVFSVKSVYHLAVEVDQCQGRWRMQVSWMDRESWIRMLNANIPPKLKVFLWQIFQRVLPTTEALIEKGIEVRPRCPVCWAEAETMEHLFLDCLVARALWVQSGLEYLGEGLPRHSFPFFLKKLFSILHQPSQYMLVTAILWRIWKSRNWVVFEGKQFGVQALMRQYNQQVNEWLRLPPDPKAPMLAVQPSPLVTVEAEGPVCRWDGAVRKGSHAAGGMVVLCEAGVVLWAAGFHFPFMDDPVVAELLTLREAIQWCLGNGFSRMTFEGDAKVVIDKIRQGDIRDSRVGVILEEIIWLLTGTSGFSVRFVGRDGNRVAHLVARKALSLFPSSCRYFDFQTWLISRM
ncbi:unnamed protein product [Linum trigynum]|uniref:Reverse transcriptase zinc-binding domain-containing protein n=1 Tax=Linum trigynum TaxID=586398 RepID=A0AAV2G9N3_9ROSI